MKKKNLQPKDGALETIQIAAPKKTHKGKVFLLSFVTTGMSLFMIFCFIMYGPISFFRNLWISTAMETLHHQWLATMLYDANTINAVVAKSNVKPIFPTTDPGLISNVKDKYPADNATELPTSAGDGERIIDGVGYIKLKGSFGDGWVIKVYDPSRVTMGISKDYGKKGERVSEMLTRTGYNAGVNASGFLDDGGHGSGGTPDKIFIYDGKVLNPASDSDDHDIIGITYDNKLVLTECTFNDVLKKDFRYAVEFKPFLIQNGKALDVSYSSLNPRTAIGQAQDGTFIFVVIDGRSVKSPGAYWEDVQKIMQQHNAYNAAILDGGSSSVFAYQGKVQNVPSTPIGERYVPNAFLIKPKK